MCRLLGWVARRPAPLAAVLHDRELQGFTALARQHCDGWGMARWNDAFGAAGASAVGTVTLTAPAVERSTACANLDPRFFEATAGAAADAGFVHLRWATPGLPVRPENTHPFVIGALAFAHNGAIHPQDRLEEIAPASWAARIAGTTDSERYFAALAARIEAGESVVDAAAAVVTRLFAEFSPTSLNATLLAPDALWVISAHDAARAPSLRESSGGENSSSDTDVNFYDLRFRVTPEAVVVASSGFPQPDDGGWRPLPNMSVLRVERGTLATAVTPLRR